MPTLQSTPWTTDDVPKTHWAAAVILGWGISQTLAGCYAMLQDWSSLFTLLYAFGGALSLVGSLLTYLFGLW